MEEHMKKMHTDAILRVASLWRINVRSPFAFCSQKRALLDEVLRQMCDKRRIISVLSSLSEREQQILGVFALKNWLIERVELPLWDISEAELGISPTQNTHEARGLLGLLLLLRVRKFGDAGSLVFVVPEEFRDAITAYFSSYTDEDAKAAGEVEAASVGNMESGAVVECGVRREEATPQILDDILVFLSHASKGIPLTPSLRKIRKEAAERIKAELSDKSEERLILIRHICETLRLVEERCLSPFSRNVRRATHTLVATKNAEEFLSKSEDERISELLRAFSRNYDGVKRCVLEELRELKPNVWYKCSFLERRVRSAIFRKKSVSEWLCFRKSAIRNVLSHLLILGLLDFTSDRFRLKPAFFKKAETASEKDESAYAKKTLIVQPNFEVLAFPETSHEVLFRLSRFSSLIRSEITKIFKITRETVLRALESGMKADEILSLLREHSRNEVPQNVIYTLKSWCDSFGKAVIKRCLMLKTSPEFLEALGRKLKIIKISEDCALICEKEAFFELFNLKEVLVLEANDDITAVEVEKATGMSAINNNKIFLINEKEADICVNALKKHGIFPVIEKMKNER